MAISVRHGIIRNLAAEDLLYMLHGLGLKTGIDLDAVCDIALWIGEALGRRPGSKLAAVTAAKRAEG